MKALFLAITMLPLLAFGQSDEEQISVVDVLPVPIAYGVIDGNAIIKTEMGIVWASTPKLGVYKIKLNRTWTSPPVVIACAMSIRPDDETVTYSASEGNTIMIYVADSDGKAVASDFSFVVYGPTE